MTQLRHDALYVIGVPYPLSASMADWAWGGRTIPSADMELLSGSCGGFGLLRYDIRKWLSNGYPAATSCNVRITPERGTSGRNRDVH
jgi:hypothetical protein